MKRRHYLPFLILAYAVLALAPWWWLDSSQSSSASVTTEISFTEPSTGTVGNEPIQPIPQHVELNQDKVALGERLFHDNRFSPDGRMACASCHIFKKGGADDLPHSPKVDGKPTATNALTIFNSSLNFRLHWNGEFARFEDQIDRVLSVSLKTTWQDIIPKLRQDPNYVREFSKIYRDGIQVSTIKDAVAAYERSLITPNSRFDKYLRGDQQAITEQEKHGYSLFKSYGCVACHQGINVGGNMFQKFGVMNDYFSDRGNITAADLGRLNITHQEEDRYRFRVASLRNVALTAPYFHDGTAQNLEEAIKVMARYQLGRPIPHQDIEYIIAFLNTLTGEYKGKSLSEYE